MTQSIRELSGKEAEFLSRLSANGQTIFSTEEARRFWGNAAYTSRVLNQLVHKRWLQRLERGVYMIIPLEAGPDRTWSENTLVIVPHLIQPAAVAYWSALHYWNLTEQVPSTIFVQCTRRKRDVDILGQRFHFVTISPVRFFGVVQRSLDGKPISITDREKTLIDAASRPDLSGGILQLAAALRAVQAELDWDRFEQYLERWTDGVAVKRLGYSIEALDLPIPNRAVRLAKWQTAATRGVSLLDPSVPKSGPVVTRWQLRINVDLTGASS